MLRIRRGRGVDDMPMAGRLCRSITKGPVSGLAAEGSLLSLPGYI